jgi:site-specific recombinase XerD
MRVQRVLVPGSECESWTLLGEDGRPVEPVERLLGYLSAIGRSPNTVKAYAHDLKDWFVFLGVRGLDWREVSLEDVAGFVAWLRLPPPARDGRVRMLSSAVPFCSEASVNRKLAALTSFSEFHARHGVGLNRLLVSMAATGRGGASTRSFKPFLHHVTKNNVQRRRTIKLPQPERRPRVLTVSEAQAVLDGCEHLRDRLLFALLLDTGVRIGEALGVRHEDLEIAEPTVSVISRANDNGARAKGGRSRSIPASGALMRLYADYLNDEYGPLDSDYVFVNLWGRPRGHPLTYPAVYDLVRRLRLRTEVDFGPHWFRHTYATWLLRRGAGMESVKELLGHASITTTIDTYGHLTIEDARATLAAAGWFTGQEVRL